MLVLAWLSVRNLMGRERLVDHYPEAAQSGCMKCHGEIEPIREIGSEMLDQIMQLGVDRGDPAGCVVCHNGEHRETEDKEIAHGGDDFYPDPGSPWVNEETCGQCHEDQVRVQWQSLMMTEAGKIQGTCWSFGGLTGYRHLYANYAVENPEDPNRRLGTRHVLDFCTRKARNRFSIIDDVAGGVARFS